MSFLNDFLPEYCSPTSVNSISVKKIFYFIKFLIRKIFFLILAILLTFFPEQRFEPVKDFVNYRKHLALI